MACGECHVREGGRLASLTGFYMPGRDQFGFLDIAGWLLVIGSLVGVGLHGVGRVVTRNGNKEA